MRTITFAALASLVTVAGAVAQTPSPAPQPDLATIKAELDQIRSTLLAHVVQPVAGQAMPNEQQKMVDRENAHNVCLSLGMASATNIDYMKIPQQNGTRPIEVVFTCALRP